MRSRLYGLSRAARAAYQFFSGHGMPWKLGSGRWETEPRATAIDRTARGAPVAARVLRPRGDVAPRTHPLGLSSLLQWCCYSSSG